MVRALRCAPMKSDLLFSLRDALRAETFVEVITPTVRKPTSAPDAASRSASIRAGSFG